MVMFYCRDLCGTYTAPFSSPSIGCRPPGRRSRDDGNVDSVIDSCSLDSVDAIVELRDGAICVVFSPVPSGHHPGPALLYGWFIERLI